MMQEILKYGIWVVAAVIGWLWLSRRSANRRSR
jgi:hypothetical protein